MGGIFCDNVESDRKDEHTAADNKLKPVFKIRVIHTLNNGRHHESAKERAKD